MPGPSDFFKMVSGCGKERKLYMRTGTIEIDSSNEKFGMILNCAVRYACGRQSYISTVVQDFIRPMIPELSNRTLWCMDQDLTEAAWWSGYGDPRIDKPGWLSFLQDVRAERARREEPPYRPIRNTEPPADEYWEKMGKDKAFEGMLSNREEYNAMVREREKAMKEPLTIRINSHGGPLPVAGNGEWIDLYSAEEVTLVPMEYRIISLGVSMELPEGYYAEIVPRSSTCKRYHIIQANSVGIIDSGYCGDNDIWGMPVIAVADTTVPKGVRIAQFRLVRKPVPVVFESVEALGNPDRGGFGSTGAR